MTVEVAFAAGVLIDPPVDRFMTDAHGYIIGVVHFQTTCDGFRRPVKVEPGSDVGKEPLVASAVMSCFVESGVHDPFDTVVPIDVALLVVGGVPPDLPADTRMMPPQAPADLSQGESGERQMANDIALFSGKMMVGHDGLLSG